jgi:hypothetical protein
VTLVADCTLENTYSPVTGKPVEAQELSASDTDKILDKVGEEFGQSVEDAIRDDVDSGRVSVTCGPPVVGQYGGHDWNTIAISPYALDPGIAAIVLVHEWLHTENCGGGPPAGGAPQDPTTDSSNNPCAPVTHMGMTSDSINKACQQLGSASPALQTKLCKLINDNVDTLVTQAGKASAAGCPPSSIPDPLSYVPLECWDFCSP